MNSLVYYYKGCASARFSLKNNRNNNFYHDNLSSYAFFILIHFAADIICLCIVHDNVSL